MFNFEGGLTAEIVNNEIHVENTEDGNFKIVGFKRYEDCKSFIEMGDFLTNSKENDYFSIMKKTDELKWIYN